MPDSSPDRMARKTYFVRADCQNQAICEDVVYDWGTYNKMATLRKKWMKLWLCHLRRYGYPGRRLQKP